MNAQEAIKYMEAKLNDRKRDLKLTHEHIYSAPIMLHDAYTKRLTSDIEAFSIVLESAKKLQEIKDKALSYAFIKDIDCSNVDLYDFAKWVYDKAEGFEVEE